VAGRAEDLAGDPFTRSSWDVVTARAVAATADLVELAFPLLKPGGSLIAWKRGDIADELAGAGRAIEALGGGSLGITEVTVAGLAEHRLVTITRATTGSVPEAYPRDPRRPQTTAVVSMARRSVGGCYPHADARGRAIRYP
jgi:16S rRNA (guanine527-N7)-methyltransferase